MGPSNDPDLEQAIAKHILDHSLDPREIENAAMTLYGSNSKKVSLVLPDVPTHTPKKRGGKKGEIKITTGKRQARPVLFCSSKQPLLGVVGNSFL